MDSSCYTCRRRRVECRMDLPPCKKCTRAGLECTQTRPLRWVKGATYRTKDAGKTATNKPGVSKSTTLLGPTVAARGVSRVQTPTHPGSVLVTGRGDRECYFRPTTITKLDDPLLSNLDETTRYYLDYYSRCVCKLFIMYDSTVNPLRNVIGAAFDSPLLLSAIIALSSRHRANAKLSYSQGGVVTSSTVLTDTDRTALRFKHKTLRGLSDAVNDAKLRALDSTITSAFLLLFLDLLESGSGTWNVHLEGVKKLITQIETHNRPKGTVQQHFGTHLISIRDFVSRQIYVIENLGPTYANPELLSNKPIPLQAAKQPLQQKLEHSYLGCPEYILDALGAFSSCRDFLLSSRPRSEAGLETRIQKVNDVLRSIESFDCGSWAATLPRLPSTSVQIQKLSKLAESYKLGAQIYGRRILDALIGEQTSQDHFVRRLIGVIHELESDANLFKCMLWPMVIAGLESREQPHREFISGCLEKFWLETRCLNVVNTGTILRRLWQWEEREESGPKHWIFRIGQLGGDWLLV
ncbi:fungal-specific transcription factor domain-containing protein [Trichoderma pleuroticola]